MYSNRQHRPFIWGGGCQHSIASKLFARQHALLPCMCCATLCCDHREGNLIWPVLLDNVTPDMRIAWEEPFGPVLPILRVPDVAAAVQHCNSSNLGLQGCVFTRDINTAMRVSDAMQTGTVQVG